MIKDGIIKNCPMAGYEVHNVPLYDLVMMRLPFLATPDDDPEDPHPGRHYSMTRLQAIELAEALLRAVQNLKELEDNPETKH